MPSGQESLTLSSSFFNTGADVLSIPTDGNQLVIRYLRSLLFIGPIYYVRENINSDCVDKRTCMHA